MKKLQNRKNEIKFWNDISKKEREWILKTPKEEIVKKILSKDPWWESLIGKIKGKKILDIGCGNTYFVAYWQLTGNQAYGSNFSPETIKNNNLLHKKLELKQNFYVASSEKIEAKNNSLDLVHMRWVIHHIPKELQDKSMQEIRRVLKKGERLIVFETNYAYPFRWIVQTTILRNLNFLRIYAIKKGWLDPEEKALTNQGYLELLKRNGFKIKKVAYERKFFWKPFVLFTKNDKLGEKVAKFDEFLFKKIIPDKFSKGIYVIAEK